MSYRRHQSTTTESGWDTLDNISDELFLFDNFFEFAKLLKYSGVTAAFSGVTAVHSGVTDVNSGVIAVHSDITAVHSDVTDVTSSHSGITARSNVFFLNDQ